MKVIVLAAGYATRLEPLTLKTPKSLLPVGGELIIDRILDKVGAIKDIVTSIYVVTNAKFFENFVSWAAGSRYSSKIGIINDGTLSNETRLGAIKDLNLVITGKAIDDDVLVVAGDNLFDLDLNKFLKFAKAKKEGVSIALYDIKELSAAKSFGVVKIDKDNKVIDFAEKPENPGSTLISTGIYYFPREKLCYIKKYVGMQDKLDAPGYYIGWLSKYDKVYGFGFTEDWYDIGTIESYKAADKKYSKKGERKR
jgi:glucose-1-phosphate thymidylyltransferase